jgi:RNA polymerase sigma-70 factor (ECF subfamily)
VHEEVDGDARVTSPVGAVAVRLDRNAGRHEATFVGLLAFAIGATVAEKPEGSLREGSPAEGGSAGSLDARFETVAPDVARLCRQLLGDPDAARDALAEVFLRARRGFASYDPERSFRSWVFAVASHYCIDLLRRRNREQRLFEPGADEAEAAAAPGPSPLRRLLEAEQRRRLEAAVEDLPPRYRAPLVLRFHAELSYDEIAARLGLNRAQVGTLLLRARRKLREALGGEEMS